MTYTHNQEFNSVFETDNSLPPISRWTSLAGLFLIGTVITSIYLSSWVKYNVTVKAAAIVRPIGETRVVQSPIEGTVKSIKVKENQMDTIKSPNMHSLASIDIKISTYSMT